MKRKEFLKTAALGITTLGTTLTSLASESSNDESNNNDPKYRSIHTIIKGDKVMVSKELEVTRTLPTRGTSIIDPFILLDQMGPVEMKPGGGAFVPPHPHRGFEPISFIIEGGAEHKDSKGNHAVLKSGDVQWMTAGSGIIHSEDMGKNTTEKNIKFQGIQLWVNLPKSKKMVEPGYQNIPSKSIPNVELDNGNAYVRLVAGQLLGATGPAHTYTSIIAAHISLKNKSHIEIPVPRDHNTFVHVLDGEIKVGTNKQVSGGSLVLFKADGDFIEIKTGENSQISNILLLSGKPINEPVVTYGPFVMNSEEEIKQAYADYQQGKMGKIDF